MKKPMLAVAATPRQRPPGPPLPRSPEVDEGALARAEQELNVTPKAAPASSPEPAAAEGQGTAAPTRRRRAKKKPDPDGVIIKGPKPVIDAFRRFKDEEEFRSFWEALEDLLVARGVKVEDFDP